MNPVQGALMVQAIVLGSAAALLGFVVGTVWAMDNKPPAAFLYNAFYVLGALALISGIAAGWAGAL